jgi:hypothetical protein
VLGGDTLWHLQKFLQHIKYFYVKVLSKCPDRNNLNELKIKVDKLKLVYDTIF